MIESIMWFGIGFLFAVLVALAVVPLIHARAVRLTIRRLENAMPQSMAELQADKDLLRAEFAMSMRQLEIRVEQLKDSNTRQRADLSKKDDIITRLKIDRETHNIEDILLKAEVATLKERFAAAGKEMKVAQSRREPELASTLPHRYAESALTVAPADSSQTSALHEARHQGDSVSLVPKDWSSTGPIVRRLDSTQLPAAIAKHGVADAMSLVPMPTPDRAGSAAPESDPNSGRAFGQPIGTVREAPESFAGLRTDASIRVSPEDQFSGERAPIGRRRFRRLALFSTLTLIGAGGFAWWPQTDEAAVMIRDLTLPLSRWLSVTTTKPLPASETRDSATSPPVAEQLEAITRDVAEMQNTVQQFAATQEQAEKDIATPKPEQATKETRLSPAPQPEPKLAPMPETRPTTIAGWTLREVSNGTAVVQGPNGVWRVTQGDRVPGVGKVVSIVRWGNRWIVATSSGLISTP